MDQHPKFNQSEIQSPFTPPAMPTRAELESIWFTQIEKLGLKPQRIMGGVPAGTGPANYYPHLWLENWNAFAYILPFRMDWDAADNAVFAEAKRLAANQSKDVLVFVGPPSNNGQNVILFSAALAKLYDGAKRIPLEQSLWSISGVFDTRDRFGWCWALVDDQSGDLYLPFDSSWSKVCTCGDKACVECADFKVFRPVVQSR